MKYVLTFFLLGFAFMILDSAWLHYRDNRRRRRNPFTTEHNQKPVRQFTAEQLKKLLK